MSTYFDKRALSNVQTWLGSETKLKGTLKFKNNMRISGQFRGEIETNGFLYIEDGAEIEANIRARDVVVGGIVRGNIYADGLVEMQENAKIYGNVRSNKLRIADGVVFEGRCEMIEKAENIDVLSMPLQEQRNEILRRQDKNNS